MHWIEWGLANVRENPMQWIATITGIVSVYLSARENIWSWPTAIVNVVLSMFIYFESGLYSDAGLQIFYLVISIYGWYEWLHGGANHSVLHVSRANKKVWLLAAGVGVPFWLLLAWVVSHAKGASLPFLDAGLATVSIIAQVMMTRKILENWVLWILADIVYVPMLLYKKIYPFAGLNAVFLALAVIGLVEWRRSYQRDHAAAPSPQPAPTPA